MTVAVTLLQYMSVNVDFNRKKVMPMSSVFKISMDIFWLHLLLYKASFSGLLPFSPELKNSYFQRYKISVSDR